MLLISIRFLLICLLISGYSCSNSEEAPSDATIHTMGFAIKGISLVAPVKPVDETVMQPIVTIKANSIAIMPYAFCSTDNPLIRYNKKGKWWGESDEGVISCIQLAHQKKLSVMLKPHLWIAHGMYTGAFTLKLENDWHLWEESYRAYILHFASLADSLKVEIFCIGTELGATIKERPRYWSSLIDTIKQVYRGKLTYAANWDDYKYFPFWKKLDYIGVDAYFPLIADKTPSVGSLNQSWIKYTAELYRISTKNNRPILFTEYGYRNVDNNSAQPWKENEGSQNDEAQANAYDAFYQSFIGKKWFMGGYVWKWYGDHDNHRVHKIDYTPQGKPAAEVIKKWYE